MTWSGVRAGAIQGLEPTSRTLGGCLDCLASVLNGSMRVLSRHAQATRPSDIHKAASGKTVEVFDTDAEVRTREAAPRARA